MKFKILIEETIVQAFEVEADSLEEAMEIGIQDYNDEIFVLDSADVNCRQICVLAEDDSETEWCEF